MGRIVGLNAKATKTLSGWISRSELEGEIESVLASGQIVRGTEGYSDVITTTVASLSRGQTIPLRWIGKGCHDLGIVPGQTATEAEVSKVIAHGIKPDGTPIPAQRLGKKSQKKQKEDAGQEEQSEQEGSERSVETKEENKRQEKISYGMVFTVPKTISLLLLHTEEEVRKAVEEAVEEALQEAIGYIDRNVTTRMQRNGVETRRTKGVTAAYVIHKASSFGEPHMHAHVLMSALVKAENGDEKYRRIDPEVVFGAIFRLAEATFYRAVKEKLLEKTTLRPEDFGINRTGSLIAFEIDSLKEGISKFSGAKEHVEEIIERIKIAPTGWEGRILAWNIHRREIKQELKENKNKNNEAGSDKKKLIEEIEHIIDKRLADGGEPAEEILNMWRQRAGNELLEKICRIKKREKGIHEILKNKIPENRSRIIQAWMKMEITEEEDDRKEFLDAAKEISQELAQEVGIWRPADFLANIMAWVDEDTARKITAEAIRQLAQAGEIKTRTPERMARVIEKGWSEDTNEMRLAFSVRSKVIPKEIENRDKKVKEITNEMSQEQRQKKSEPRIEEQTLNPEQFRALVKMTEGKGIVTIEGTAGSGKSFILQLLAMYTEEKITVISRNAKLASELGEQIQADAETVAKFIQRKKAPNGIVIVDEASLIDQKDFLKILEMVQENKACRVIAIGDRRQLTPIDKIGTWHSVVEETSKNGAHIMLATSWRCRKWDAEHRKWRDGTLNVNEISDRIIEGDLDKAAEKALETNATVIATTNEAVAEISEKIQQRKGIQRDLRTRLRFQCACGIGDEVRIRKNDYTKGIFNGQTGTVIGIAENGDIKVKRKKGKEVILSKDFTSEHVELAYAVTADSAQGMTTERSLIWLGQGAWNLNQLYVAASRGVDPPIVVGQNARERLEEYLKAPAEVTIIREECERIEKENKQENQVREESIDSTWEPILMSFMASKIRTIETIAHEIRNERQTETNHEDQVRYKEAEKPKPQLPPRPHHGIGR